MKCEICGKALKSQKRFCGHACRSVWYSGKMAADRTRPCVVCGKPFSDKGHRETCSKECRYSLMRKTFAERGIRPAPHTDEQRAASSERMKGAGCPKFNGYRAKTGSGGAYVKVRPPDGYPYPQSLDGHGYIREHRMVMELSIGRPLDRLEVVHHINADTHDNRIENLRIFSTNGKHVSSERKGKPVSGHPVAPCAEGCGRMVARWGRKQYDACRKCRSTAAYRASGKPDAINYDGKPCS